MELYHRIIFMKRIPGMPGTSPQNPGIPGIPRARAWDPRDAPGTPWTRLGPPGTSLGPSGRPWDPGARSWDPQGRPWDPPGTPLGRLGTPGTPYGALMDHKNGYISTNRQREKLSIAVFEAAHQGPSHERPDLTVLPIKRPPKPKKIPPILGCRPGRGTNALAPYVPGYIYRYI